MPSGKGDLRPNMSFKITKKNMEDLMMKRDQGDREFDMEGERGERDYNTEAKKEEGQQSKCMN